MRTRLELRSVNTWNLVFFARPIPNDVTPSKSPACTLVMTLGVGNLRARIVGPWLSCARAPSKRTRRMARPAIRTGSPEASPINRSTYRTPITRADRPRTRRRSCRSPDGEQPARPPPWLSPGGRNLMSEPTGDDARGGDQPSQEETTQPVGGFSSHAPTTEIHCWHFTGRTAGRLHQSQGPQNGRRAGHSGAPHRRPGGDQGSALERARGPGRRVRRRLRAPRSRLSLEHRSSAFERKSSWK